MERIVITEEQMQKAVSYVPIKTKEDFVDNCCGLCIAKTQINLGIGENAGMPDMSIENTFIKSRCLMTALCVLYIGIPISDIKRTGNNPWLMEEDEYDRYAMSHIVNQIERMKGNANLRDKAFDLLRDYRDLEKRLNTSIYNMMAVMNDPINRMFQKLATDISSAALEEQKKSLEELQKQMEALKEENQAKE